MIFAKFSFAFYVFTNSFNCSKHSSWLEFALSFFENVIKIEMVSIPNYDLSEKTDFSNVLQSSCSNLTLKLCQVLQSYRNCQTNQIEGVWWKLEAKKCFQRQPFTNYLIQTVVFHVKQCITGKVKFLFFRRFLLAQTKFSFQEEN